MAIATLVHPIQGTVNFINAVTPTGWPIDVANAEEEELRSPGVDGRRWRTTSKQETEITMTTIADATTYAAVIALAQTHMRCKTGDPVIVTVTISGKNYRFRNVHVLDVQPQAVPGPAVGANATSGSTAHLITAWRLMLMDTATVGEVG